MKSPLRTVLRDDRGQDAFEYLLASGLVAVAVYLGMVIFGEAAPQIVGHACSSVDTATSPPPADGSCVNETP